MKTVVIPPSTDGEGSEVRLETAGLSNAGRARQKNEDQFLIATVERRLDVANTSLTEDVIRWLPGTTRGTVLLVADGIGGGAAGEVASAVAVKAIVETLCNATPATGAAAARQSRLRAQTLPGVRVGLQSALAAGDAEIRRAAGEGSPSSVRGLQMGTTATLGYVIWPQLYVAHAGDSRCYLLRDGTLQLLTTDHTYAERFRAQSGTPADPDSPWHHVLWNALGGVRNAVLQPEINRVPLQLYDTLVLCTDGLTKHVSDDTIARVASNASDAADAVETLVAMAMAGGGSDNTTVIVARCLPANG
jgi:protein phosphatase